MKRTRAGALAAALLGATALGGCVSAPRLPAAPVAAAPQPVFDPLTFFTGTLTGEARLAKLFSKTVPVRVESNGRVVDGALHLHQVVHEGDKPARERDWVIRQTGPGRYAGTLSDAAGPITGVVEGNRLILDFEMDGGLKAHQVLTLSSDGQRARNVMTIRKLGLRVAVLTEDIRKGD